MRASLLGKGVILVFGLTTQISAAFAAEKGMGAWYFSGAKAAEISATWYYNWSPYAKGAESTFVPMIAGSQHDNTAAYNAAKGASSAELLGPNEPDNCGRGGNCLSVQRVLQMWPRLEATGKRLGSPAVASNYHWLDQFLAGARQNGYRVDFLAVHNYRPNFTDPEKAAAETIGHLQWVHQRYQMPIWFTEFGFLNNIPQPLANRYIRAVLPQIEALDFVERYAWFGDHTYYGTASSALWNDKGQLSETGRVYGCPTCE